MVEKFQVFMMKKIDIFLSSFRQSFDAVRNIAVGKNESENEERGGREISEQW